jgi:hypothetical protein
MNQLSNAISSSARAAPSERAEKAARKKVTLKNERLGGAVNMSATSSRSSRATLLGASGLHFLSVIPWQCYLLVANGDISAFLFFF